VIEWALIVVLRIVLTSKLYKISESVLTSENPKKIPGCSKI